MYHLLNTCVVGPGAAGAWRSAAASTEAAARRQARPPLLGLRRRTGRAPPEAYTHKNG